MSRAISLVPAMALLFIIGCENSQRSLVFSTGTSWGIEIAVKPQTDAPINLLIGYKRAEVLFDPIMEDSGLASVTSSKHRTYTIKDKPHSVIAKLLGEVKGNGKATGSEVNASMNVAQWFASGDAAEILAKSGGAAALTDNEEIADAVARAYLGQSIRPEDTTLLVTLLTSVHDGLSTLNASGDAQAKQLIADLASLAPSFITAKIKSLHLFDLPANSTTVVDTGVIHLNEPVSFQEVVATWAQIDLSVRSLRDARALARAGQIQFGAAGGVTTTLTRDNLEQVLAESEEELKRLQDSLRGHPKVIAAVDYYLKKLRGN